MDTNKKDIIDYENIKDKKISKEELRNLKEILTDMLNFENIENRDITKSLGTLLNLPEEEFNVLAPGLLESFSQSLNNPNDKIILTQALNVTGAKAEDLVSNFLKISESIDSVKIISQQKRDFLKQILGTICNAINDTEGISKRLIQIPIEFCNENAKLPEYANISDSGLDLYALEDYTIKPGETKLIPTGLKVALPPGFELQVRPKSGRALKTKLRVANTPGTIKVA